ncbi:ATP-binding protein [Parathalassolituus penaei]|uniref:histidine kinase n=1 Tax=Parathalassolituus penaei TaxID=2997323 RepID=A0A9X3ECF7_9GAMM|nr:ATP-binding protein [Parathalassolituus penaei]MCY0965058.1 PAS-domain containing protein [Parathalassolituus penaei]
MLNRLLPARWRSLRAGSRLLLAFLVLATSTIGLAFMGWRSLNDTEQAVAAFEQHSLPEISRSLELAERTANLAAMAPYLAGVSSPFMLQGLSQTLEEKIRHVLELAATLPQLDAASPDLQPLLEQLERNTNNLINTTRQTLFIREDIRQAGYRLHQLQQRINGDAATVTSLVNLLLLTTRADDNSELLSLQQQCDQQLTAIRASVADENDIEQLQLLCSDEHQSLASLRRQQLQQEEQSAWLLASTRAISEQLSNAVTHFVDQTRQRINRESRQVAHTATSGQTGILLISLLCLLAAGGGIAIVGSLGRGLTQVTAVMTRLASGNVEQQTPAIERRDELGELARAFEVFRENAVEKERISRHLSEQTRLLETVFSNITDGLSVFDSEGRLLAWNPHYARILAIPANSIRKGMTLTELHNLLPAAAREGWSQMGTLLDMNEINRQRQSSNLRFERHFSDGREVEFRSSPLPTGGFVTLYTDVTERKTIEAQLRQAQKMEVLGQLTGGVAHDFNNLLAAMFGNLQLLDDSISTGLFSDPDDQSRALKRVRRALAAAERGNNLTRRLLAFSRKQQLEPKPIHVDDLIRGMDDLFEYSIADPVKLELDLNSRGAEVEVDPSQLENALLNLAINACAAMPDGGSLRISSRCIQRNGSGWVNIRITDTGCGIPRELLARVFEPFFTTKDIGEGSGLGLSMVYGFVKQSHGDIHINSEVGKGTRISILLPQLPASRQTATTPATNTDNNGPTALSAHLLLVEDDEQVALATIEQLESLGYGCVHVTSAEQALQTLANGLQVSLVLSDINLGAGQHGLSLRQQLADTYPQLPVVLTSGLNAQQLQQRYGINPQPLLPKPFQRQQLATVIRDCLENGSPV